MIARFEASLDHSMTLSKKEGCTFLFLVLGNQPRVLCTLPVPPSYTISPSNLSYLLTVK
jgi:hypothetical protein